MKLQTIKSIYNELNTTVFGECLEMPVMLISRMADSHAQYINSNGTLPARMEFNFTDVKGLRLARSIIYHEMIHQFIEEIMQKEEKEHHGPMFIQQYNFLQPSGVDLGIEL